MMRRLLSIAALLMLSLFGPLASADSLFFKDGRYYEVPKLVEQEQELHVIYNYGTVVVEKALVKQFFIEQEDGALEPKNEAEAEKIKRGLVPFEGRWIPKARRRQLIGRRDQEIRDKLGEYRKHQKWRDRYKESTKHFNFEYTVPQDVGREYQEMFEAYYSVFAKDWKIQQPKGRRLKVCFYNNASDFRRIGNVRSGVLGYFRFVEPIELNFFYERRDRRLTLDVLFHELNHYLFHLYTKNNWKLSAWLEEGMAEYYGASQWDPDQGKMTVGHLQEGRLVRLMDEMDGGKIQSLESLMREPAINAIQYAWSWSLCHMLLESPRYKTKFKKYLEKMARGKAERETYPVNSRFMWVKRDHAIGQFQKMLGIRDLDAFEKNWHDYIRALDVESARGYHSAALFCKRWNRPIRATMYFKQAVEMSSDNPATYESLGKLLIGQEKFSEAARALEVGIKLDPFNPYLYISLGKAHREMGDEENLEHGKQLQLLAFEIDPNDIGLLNGLDAEVLAEVPAALGE